MDLLLIKRRIYIYLLFNILNNLPCYTQNSHLITISDTELHSIISSDNPNNFFEKKCHTIESAEDTLILEIKRDEISDSKMTVDTIPWHKFDLGSPLMKKKSANPFRWWIPATIAGAAIGLTGTALIIRAKVTMPPEPTIDAINDFITVPCKVNTEIFPLINDTGEGLRIIAVSGAPSGWVSFTDQSINILEAASQNFTFIYTIIDNNGAQANATVTVTIEYSSIQLQNPIFQGSPGDIISHQIFANAVCTQCTVTAANSTPQANFSWTPTGTFSFELPNVSQPQTFLFTFTVTDRCMQTGIAQISVTVRPVCDIEPTFIVSNEECDFKDGSIQIVIDPLSNYQFKWNNGNNTALNSGLSGGIYRVTVSLISDPLCSAVFDIEVLSSGQTINLTDDRYQAVANTLLTGNVLNNDAGSGLRVTSFEDLDVLEFSIQPDGSFRFLADESAEDQYSSVYTVTDICGNTATATVQFEVAKLPCEFSAAITTLPADCGRANGSASVIVSPAGAPYEVRWPNGIIGPAASGFAAGSYTLLITNTANNCVLSFGFTITEKPAPEYIQTVSTSAATCVGGGQIDLILNDPGGSGMQLIVLRENLPFISMNVNTGLIQLGEIANILPGNYQISVTCTGCPARCAQIMNITITQILPLLEINDDVGSTPVNISWTGNVLLNDFGTGMNVIGFTQPSEGIASVNSIGLAVYTPPAGFSGTVTFIYTVRDSCGQEKSATVTINVEAIPCDFTAQFSNIPADCGQMNGSSTITISPSGNIYQANWSDGSQGLTNQMLSPGNYTVTISNSNAACSQVFNTIIEELPPPNLIQQVTSTPSSCLNDGSVIFTILNTESIDIVVEIYLNNQFIFSISIPAFGTVTEEIDSLSEGNYLFQALESGSPRRCADNEVIEIGNTILPMMLMDDNHTIPFGTVWIGNVLSNDIGTALEVNGFTPSPDGIVQILSNGMTTFIPSPGFSGTATFIYTARDTCKQEQMATVNITVLPSIGNLIQTNSSVVTSFEFIQQPISLAYPLLLNPIPEGIASQQLMIAPSFQNGFRYSMYHKQWLFRTELTYGETVASGDQSQRLYQNNFQTRAGVGWFHDFNGNRIITEAGFAAASNKTVFSNSISSTLSRHSVQALYFKAEYQIKLQSGYCIFWEPLIFYLPVNRQWTGTVCAGFKYIFE